VPSYSGGLKKFCLQVNKKWRKGDIQVTPKKSTFNLYLQLCVISSNFNTHFPTFNEFLNSVLASLTLLVTQTCFTHLFLLKLPHPTSNCPYIKAVITIHSECQWEEFFTVKNSITAGCLNHVLTIFHFGWQKLELWIAVGPGLCKVEGRYHMTVWNWFSSSFQYTSKKHDREGKTLQHNLYGCKNVQIHLTDWSSK